LTKPTPVIPSVSGFPQKSKLPILSSAGSSGPSSVAGPSTGPIVDRTENCSETSGIGSSSSHSPELAENKNSKLKTHEDLHSLPGKHGKILIFRYFRNYSIFFYFFGIFDVNIFRL